MQKADNYDHIFQLQNDVKDLQEKVFDLEININKSKTLQLKKEKNIVEMFSIPELSEKLFTYNDLKHEYEVYASKLRKIKEERARTKVTKLHLHHQIRELQEEYNNLKTQIKVPLEATKTNSLENKYKILQKKFQVINENYNANIKVLNITIKKLENELDFCNKNEEGIKLSLSEKEKLINSRQASMLELKGIKNDQKY